MARFTDQQLDNANCIDLVNFLRSKGEKLVKSGSEYRWVYRDGAGEHDSITIRSGEWFDHKRQLGGDAIGFLQEFYNMEFREAVEILINQKPSDSSQYAEKASYTKAESQRKLFTLPAKAANMHRLYAYLCKTRSIAPEVISHFVHAGTLYEEAQFHNAVFIATDENGNPCGGMKKGTLSGTSFRQTITGSDTHYAFHHKGSSGRVYVFEAAVDMLSYISLYPQDWQQHSYLALDGLSPKSLLHFLDKYEGVREICLCLDNDAAGIEATERITVQLQEREYTDVSVLVPELKDWNEAAVAQTHAQDFPEPEMTMD